MPLDSDMRPLRNGITWVDTRSKTEVEKLKKAYADKIHGISGRYQTSTHRIPRSCGYASMRLPCSAGRAEASACTLLEGIIFEQKYLYDETQKYLNEKIEEIVLLGGGARSPLWRQIVADIVGIPVLIPTTLESTCLGAAMLAASAVGIYPGVSEASKNMSAVKDKYTPVKKNRDFYLKIYEEVYRSLFRTIQDLVDKFTKITLFENHIDY